MKFNFRRQKNYSVSPDRDDWMAPEDTLVDSSSTLSSVEMPVSDSIFRIASFLVGLFVIILIGASGRLAVAKYDYFASIGLRNRTINVSVPPPRGIIMDRMGVPLVANVPSFDVLVISRQVHRNIDGTFADIAQMAQILGKNTEELTLQLTDGIAKNAVFFIATDIPREQVLSLRTVLPDGFSIITSTKRQYPDAQQFAHIIGYVGKVNRDDMARDEYYVPSDTIGRLGVESSYEDVLRGEHGQLVFTSAEDTADHTAAAGHNLVLDVDAQAQKALFSSMYGLLRESGLGEAAGVVQDPKTGAVLALASFPTYDNNVFNGQLSQADFEALFNNPQHPLLDRAIAGRYNPGSTIKPFIGMTALQEKIVTSTEVVTNDCISLIVPNPNNPSDPYVFKNWRPDTGPFTLRRAIAQSCNVYFFTVGGGYGTIKGLGVERIASYLKKSFADSVLGIDLPGEDHGFVPTPDWKYATQKEPWYQGDTYNISIGQGDLVVTPLWINTYVSAIANGGTLWRPQIADRVVDDQRNTLETYKPEQLGTLPFSDAVIHEMQMAMRQTVIDGTARLFSDLPVTAAAKTGTAEVIKGHRINSLLTVYAPADDPQIAMTLLFEGSSSNQGYALRAAHEFLKWYFTPNHGIVAATPSPTPSVSVSPQATASVSVTPLLEIGH